MATSKGRMRRPGLILACVLSLAPASPAWALFGYDELNKRVNALDARLGQLETAVQQNQQLLDLLKEVEALKAELARMRGQAEVQAHQLETLGKRQNDLYADLDQRVADLAKTAGPEAGADAAQAASAPTAGDSPQLDPLAESRSYEAALAQFREGNYPAAIAGFNSFLKVYPGSALAPNAQYWIGYAYYSLKDYKSALAHQQKLVLAYPSSGKVPDALLNIAVNQIALDDLAGARKTLEGLVAKYPGTEAAKLAARRLTTLK